MRHAHRRDRDRRLRASLPRSPPNLMELDEVLETLHVDREELHRLMQQAKVPSPTKRWSKVEGQWVPHPRWNRAAVLQAALTRTLVSAYRNPAF
jgi:hypothetical protein